MNNLDKNKIKDILILSLVDSLAELYSVNLNIKKETIYDNIVAKLNNYDILDINTTNIDIESAKNKLIKYITTDITKDLQLYNPTTPLSFFRNFNDITLIGQGGNGWVYKIFNPLDNNTYAIKKIGIKKNFLLALNEIRAMATFNHKNIVRYYNSWIESKSIDEKIHLINTHLLTDKSDNDSNDNSDWEELDESNYNKFLFIQMELCLCNLKEYLIQNDLSLKEKKIFGQQILKGIDYIHKQNYIHRDIKLSNIFYGLDNKIKIGDFGLITKTVDYLDEDVGTIGYTAPEVLNNKSYNHKADLYSLGVVFLELFCNIKTDMEKIYLIKDARQNKLKHIDKNIEKLINSLIKENPNNRISISECLLLMED